MSTFNLLLLIVIIILLLLSLKNIKANKKERAGIYITQAKELIKNNYFDYIIDVRDEYEWNNDKIISSINIPLEKIYEDVQLYELKANFLLYSERGKKASEAAAIMKKMGYKNVKFLIGNYKLIK